MTTFEFLYTNGVHLLRADKTEAISLGWWKIAENLSNVIGKKVWICDFYNNEENVFRKPIRAISPRQAAVFAANDAKKTAYYSPIFFRELKEDGSVKSTKINVIDNTGYRSIIGISLQIFEDEESCVECYKQLLEKAIQERKTALVKVINGIQELENELSRL